MITLHINLEGDGILEGFPADKIIDIVTPITITALAGGMKSGAPSVAFIFDLPDGRKVLAQTSLRLLLQAARILEAKFTPTGGDVGVVSGGRA